MVFKICCIILSGSVGKAVRTNLMGDTGDATLRLKKDKPERCQASQGLRLD